MNLNLLTPSSANASHEHHLARMTRKKVLWSLGVSFFAAIFLWGFWDKGPFALGLNAFVYFALTTGLFLWSLHHKEVDLKKNLYWIVPSGLIIASFLVYDNPFLKMISLLVLVATCATFTNVSMLTEQHKAYWDAHFFAKLISRVFSALKSLHESVVSHTHLLSSSKKSNGVVVRIVLGVAIFLVIAFVIVIPLLSVADAVFEARMDAAFGWLLKLIPAAVADKTILALVMSFGTVAGVLAWTKPFTYTDEKHDKKFMDPIVVGIVLGGILGLYLLFLLIQVEHLWVGNLPINFKQTEHLVKSGFWQLIALSIVNILIYMVTYRRTIPAIQKILVAFMVASLLLLTSAGQRMFLYVINYGFSYEKFFAAYTVLFCGILFIWLISRLFVHQRSDIAKFLIVLFLWMYSLATVFPVEQFILRANVALSHREGSQIRLYELTMLSPDVLSLVKRYEREGTLNQNYALFDREKNTYTDDNVKSWWGGWIEEREKEVMTKKWYERNLVNVLYIWGEK